GGPGEPLEVAPATDRAPRLELSLDLVRCPRQPVLHLAHAVDGPLRRRQRRVRIQRILRRVLGGAKRLPETESSEIILEARVIGVAQQSDRLCLGIAEVHCAEGTDTLTETELPAGRRGHILVHTAQALEVWRIRDQDPGNDAGLRGVADRRLAHRERLEHRRMRQLIRLRHHAYLSNHTRIVDLTGGAVAAGPVGDRPAPDSFFIWIWHLVVLAVVI